ncbi:hypothetical protein TNCV_1501201 [Trichonephila clavipes]|uniref:Uncharacterized protein n=1 Tax=Trichonephila clavipes TaxID=2585209 RepID=A0A8X6RT21_TRICX|nr:hypothetical protein TNCV_1501201 [Trichonephila clavipes]
MIQDCNPSSSSPFSSPSVSSLPLLLPPPVSSLSLPGSPVYIVDPLPDLVCGSTCCQLQVRAQSPHDEVTRRVKDPFVCPLTEVRRRSLPSDWIGWTASLQCLNGQPPNRLFHFFLSLTDPSEKKVNYVYHPPRWDPMDMLGGKAILIAIQRPSFRRDLERNEAEGGGSSEGRGGPSTKWNFSLSSSSG